ncbi:hypothetical protein ANACOL_00365 [Anaerotruncus colihominis DSM 17241]|uniref:Uncharacterized protein n=1 Tax=Anaerotruncus colihominis DSM 17241 TaxID=445972 RepID=B0P6I8_9FIRM|nr:hypothetical protein ANACOL_00365 [Anaerotruncus colihominis DSM 17241]
MKKGRSGTDFLAASRTSCFFARPKYNPVCLKQDFYPALPC